MKKLFVMFAVSALLVSCGETTKSSEVCDSTKACCKDSTQCDTTKVCTDTTSVDTTKVSH
jgi:hypothetical protein